MTEKKEAPAQTGAIRDELRKQHESSKRAEEVNHRYSRHVLQNARAGRYRDPDTDLPSVSIYRQGMMLHRPVKGVKPPNSGGKRDVIIGWSMKSRRRMREYMLTHCAPEGWLTIGPTFTIPGPVMPPREAAKLFADFSLQVYKHGWGMIWRVEVQQRGALHWHALLIGPKESHPNDVSMLWADCLRSLPALPEYETEKTTYLNISRAALPGASRYACVVPDADAKRGAWLRYLQDHSTKAKQEQIPESIGRHWGVVGRKRFVEHEPIIKVDLTDRQYAKALRAFQRLWTPSRPNPAAPFGRSLSYSPTRGRRGHAVAYTNPITAARICEWAKADLVPF
jgi:hypothetical protein